MFFISQYLQEIRNLKNIISQNLQKSNFQENSWQEKDLIPSSGLIKMEIFTKIVNSFQLLTMFAENSILDIWHALKLSML